MIEIIDLLKPKNGGSFKLIEDIDIAVSGYSSLADCVAHMATTAMIEAINAVLSGKQDKLTTAQLAACNSGITSELVAQISLNTTAIAGKADAVDLAALESEVDSKADSSDLTTATANLQAQIDNIVSGSTADSEVINARVGEDGTSYPTLNARITADDNAIKSELSKYFGTFTDISSSLTSGQIAYADPMVLTPSANNEYKYGIFNCSENDRFRLVGTGASSYRMWTFIDADNAVISVSDPMTDYNVSKDIMITAPANAVKLVVNFRITIVSCAAYKLSGGKYYEDIDSINGSIDNLEDKMDYLITDTKAMFSDVTLTQGYSVEGNTGNLHENADYYASDYIDVSKTDHISLFNVQQSAIYNSNKVYIAELGHITSTLTEETEFSLPANAAYVRCSIYKTRTETAYYKSPKNGYTCGIKMSDLENDAGYLKENIIRIGATRDYTTLRAGIAEAIKTRGTKVYVDAGTYDLTTEFAAEITAAGTDQFGIRLENDVHVIFSSGATVTAIYTGGVSNVENHFAPFFADNRNGESDFTLENLNIVSKNTRYCVHDECGGSSGAYNHRYINCKMNQDNVSASIGKAMYPQCIGGGLGKYGYIDIEGCYFKSKRAETEKTNCVSYHNNSNSNSKSNINVRDCYFADYGTFRVTHYGTSTEVSKAIICNCSLGLAPYIEHESGSSGPENMNLTAYMNEIRNNEPPVAQA